MKVAHVNFAKGYRGGERQTELLIKALAKLGVQQVAMVRHDSPLLGKLKNLQGLELRACKKPYIFNNVGTVDLVHAHEAKAAQWAYLNSRIRGTSYVITRRVMKVPKSNFFTRHVYQSAIAVIGLSKAIEQSMHQRFPDLEINVIGDIYANLSWSKNAIDAVPLPSRAESIVVGQIGALSMKDKAQHLAIEAFRLLPKERFSLVFIGEGKDRTHLEKLARDMDNVYFLGFKEDVGNWLRKLNIFIFPSLSEGFGSSILDAMGAEVPVIASDAGGIPEIVKDRETGLVVPTGNADKLAEAILTISDDKDLSGHIIARAKETLEQYSADKIANQYLSLYLSKLSK